MSAPRLAEPAANVVISPSRRMPSTAPGTSWVSMAASSCFCMVMTSRCVGGGRILRPERTRGPRALEGFDALGRKTRRVGRDDLGGQLGEAGAEVLARL